MFLFKNVAGQQVFATLIYPGTITASTIAQGAAQGGVTCFVCKDGGAQAAGAGSIAHMGQGCWRYTPTQAETNANFIGITFVQTAPPNGTANPVTLTFTTKVIGAGDITATEAPNLDAAVSSIAVATAAGVLASVIEAGITLEELCRLFTGALAGSTTVDPDDDTTFSFMSQDGSTIRFTAVIDSSSKVRTITIGDLS